MVREALIRLTDAGMRVHTVTCDCIYVNQDNARHLKVDLNLFSLASAFPHPTLPVIASASSQATYHLFLEKSSHMSLINFLNGLKVVRRASYT